HACRNKLHRQSPTTARMPLKDASPSLEPACLPKKPSPKALEAPRAAPVTPLSERQWASFPSSTHHTFSTRPTPKHFYPTKNRRKTKPWPEPSGLALLLLVPWREEQVGRQGLVSDTDIPRHPHRRGNAAFVLTMPAALGVAACDRTNDQHAETRHPQQAGQPVNPYAMAGHIVAGRADLLTGDSRGAQKHLQAMANDFVVMVGDQQHRSMAMIDEVCFALEPLGDTLAVVVNVQDVTAKNPDGATTLSRNCQLQEGERAFLQAKREVDVVPKETRERFKEMQRK
ncbi:MAG: hypothetical protein ABI120_25405, partial [Gemmatimonadaceae bacterium]